MQSRVRSMRSRQGRIGAKCIDPGGGGGARGAPSGKVPSGVGPWLSDRQSHLQGGDSSQCCWSLGTPASSRDGIDEPIHPKPVH
jgi:hypothetical protein